MPTPTSIQRYVRRHVHKNSFDLFVSCLPGIEHDIRVELETLVPGLVPRTETGGLSVRATIPDMYRMNLGLSTASRILLRLAEFTAWSLPMLFNHTGRVYWPAFVPDPELVDVRVSSRKSRLNMNGKMEASVKAAVARTFEHASPANIGKRSTLYLRIVHDHATLSLDTTGEHLHKRGDKVLTDVAPLRATLASTALRRAVTADVRTVCDPFAGSGTVMMEAMRILQGLPPGANRTFAFMHHPYFKAGTWRQTLREDASTRGPRPGAEIVGGDVSEDSVQTTRRNLEALHGTAGVRTDIVRRGFHETLAVARGIASEGALVTNPPYGIRLMTNAGARRLQEDFAKELEQMPRGWHFGIFTPFRDVYASRNNLMIEQELALRVGGRPVWLVQGHATDGD